MAANIQFESATEFYQAVDAIAGHWQERPQSAVNILAVLKQKRFQHLYLPLLDHPRLRKLLYPFPARHLYENTAALLAGSAWDEFPKVQAAMLGLVLLMSG
jgi:exonuclease I